MISYYDTWLKVRDAVIQGGEPANRSNVRKYKPMKDIMMDVNSLARAMGVEMTDDSMFEAMMTIEHDLRVSWRNKGEMARDAFRNWSVMHNYPSHMVNGGNGQGQGQGQGQNGQGQNGQGQGQGQGQGGNGGNGDQGQGQGQGKGQGGQGGGVQMTPKPGNFDGQDEGNEDGEENEEEEDMDGDGQGQGGQGTSDPIQQRITKNDILPGDEPVTPGYRPPKKIWAQCCAIIRYNLENPDRMLNVMLVGPKGIGKTRMVMELSKKFFNNLPFITTSPQQEYKIIGYGNAMGDYVPSTHVKGYEGFGINLLEEIDRSDSCALISINAATANGVLDTQKGVIEKSRRSIYFATANTTGTGASIEYNTANQLDASTRDRWIYLMMEWDHDVAVEVSGGDTELVFGLEQWNRACEQTDAGMFTVSYRSIQEILGLVAMPNKVFDFTDAIQAAVVKHSLDETTLLSIIERMEQHNKVAQAVNCLYRDLVAKNKV